MQNFQRTYILFYAPQVRSFVLSRLPNCECYILKTEWIDLNASGPGARQAVVNLVSQEIKSQGHRRPGGGISLNPLSRVEAYNQQRKCQTWEGEGAAQFYLSRIAGMCLADALIITRHSLV